MRSKRKDEEIDEEGQNTAFGALVLLAIKSLCSKQNQWFVSQYYIIWHILGNTLT